MMIRMRLLTPILIVVAMAGSVAAMCAAQANRHPASAISHSAAGSHNPSIKGASTEEGERVFTQNCSRCHNAPEGFSPRISGTIAQHMRVRAGLSREDEKVLLRFLNP